MEKAIANVRIGLTGYPEINFEPVPLTSNDDLMKLKKYDKMIHQEQAILFGMDIL